jgi:hypothetical protein
VNDQKGTHGFIRFLAWSAPFIVIGAAASFFIFWVCFLGETPGCFGHARYTDGPEIVQFNDDAPVQRHFRLLIEKRGLGEGFFANAYLDLSLSPNQKIPEGSGIVMTLKGPEGISPQTSETTAGNDGIDFLNGGVEMLQEQFECIADKCAADFNVTFAPKGMFPKGLNFQFNVGGNAGRTPCDEDDFRVWLEEVAPSTE